MRDDADDSTVYIEMKTADEFTNRVISDQLVRCWIICCSSVVASGTSTRILIKEGRGILALKIWRKEAEFSGFMSPPPPPEKVPCLIYVRI